MSWRPWAILVEVAVPSLAAATVAVAFLQDTLGVPNPSAVYLVAVVLTAVVSGTAGAVATAVASFMLYNFLFTEPRYTLSMHDSGVWLSVVLLLFAGIVVGQLAAMQRSRAALSAAREREARALFRVSRELATRTSVDAVLPDIAASLRTETHMDGIWIAIGAPDARDRVVAEAVGAQDVPSPRQPPGVFTQLRRTPGDEPAAWVRVHQPSPRARAATGFDAYRVLIETGGTATGSIWAVRRHGHGQPDATETRLLSAAADQLGQAIAHDRLEAEAQAAEVARQSDALKSALLQSVSHDLRTPLATIRAAAGTLRSAVGVDPAAQRDSADAIDREAEYLNRLVTNLLDLSRIEAGALSASSDAFELDDLLGSTLERFSPRLAGRPLEVALDAPPVEVDAVLLDEAFANLLENVVKHTPADAAVRIGAHALDDGFVRLTVEDGGPGVSADVLPRLFDKFYRAPSSQRGSRAGTGIGLAVAKGLVEAMGGRMAVRGSALGGLAFDIDLPAAPVPAELAGEPAR